MTKIWHDSAWEDYVYWQTQDKKTLKRINKLDISPKEERLSDDLCIRGMWRH